MAKTDNLTDFMVDLADGIRAKKGTTEPINPQDFRKEIESISGGGGSGEVEGDWEYYDTSNADEVSPMGVYLGCIQKLAEKRNGVVIPKKIGCFLYAFPSSDYDVIIQVGVDFSQPCIDASGKRTLREQIALYPDSELAMIVASLQTCPRLTKEQFYKLD